jgi:tRNA 5-methylaminomethyl-2-thiouridine biosynthesis bifunctional protein
MVPMLLRATFRLRRDLLLKQARQVFLQGCGLPEAWTGQQNWRVLETQFGLGLNFLLTWQAWSNDPERPNLLHFVSTEAFPVSVENLLYEAAQHPDLLPLAVQLSEQWRGLLPGFHRLVFEGGNVLLTIGIGDTKTLLKEQSFEADSVYLSNFNPQLDPNLWDTHSLKAVARCCRRGTRLVCLKVAGSTVDSLTQAGFEVTKTHGIALQNEDEHLQARFNPRWEPKKAADPNQPKPRLPKRCVVVGAGLAGAACAASLARRGWQVTVLDAHESAAGGASALPAGMLAPHTSPDDSLLSRLTRNGLRATWQVVKTQLLADIDWQANGVLQRKFDASGNLPGQWPEAGEHWSRLAGPVENSALQSATGPVCQQLASDVKPALWHASGGWIKPKRLVGALLETSGISQRYGGKVSHVQRASTSDPDALWQVLDTHGECLAEAELVVLAAGFESAGLVPSERLTLQAIRGQVAWGPVTDATAMPPFPVNGHGSFIPAFKSDDNKTRWLMGATFERGNNNPDIKVKDRQDIYERLQRLLPQTAEVLKASFDESQAWAGVRCVSPDRLPIVGPLDDAALPGLWVCTALGSRGLSFAVLCGELMAAWLHAEPLPIEKRLAQSLLANRHRLSE